MKLHIASLSLLTVCCLMLAVAPAVAGVYTSGPPNGTIAAPPINFGGSVSDSYVLTPPTPANALDFVYWDASNTVLLQTVDVALGSSPFGGTPETITSILSTCLFSCLPNLFGFYIMDAHLNLEVNSPAGWITLSNACTGPCTGTLPIGWDECTPGPGCAGEAFSLPRGSPYEVAQTSIPAESFTLSVPGGTTPEPSSIILFGSGILGLAGVLRRKLF